VLREVVNVLMVVVVAAVVAAEGQTCIRYYLYYLLFCP
jgi:hypothetical protein